MDDVTPLTVRHALYENKTAGLFPRKSRIEARQFIFVLPNGALCACSSSATLAAAILFTPLA